MQASLQLLRCGPDLILGRGEAATRARLPPQTRLLPRPLSREGSLGLMEALPSCWQGQPSMGWCRGLPLLGLGGPL